MFFSDFMLYSSFYHSYGLRLYEIRPFWLTNYCVALSMFQQISRNTTNIQFFELDVVFLWNIMLQRLDLDTKMQCTTINRQMKKGLKREKITSNGPTYFRDWKGSWFSLLGFTRSIIRHFPILCVSQPRFKSIDGYLLQCK